MSSGVWGAGLLVLARRFAEAMPIQSRTAQEQRRAELRAGGLGLTIGRPVTQATTNLRARYWDSFISWALETGLEAEVILAPSISVDDLNLLLVRYGRDLYRAGRTYNQYAETINALVDRRPAIRRLLQGAWDLGYTWTKQEPSQHHVAMPVQILVSLLTVSLMWGWTWVWLSVVYFGQVNCYQRGAAYIMQTTENGELCRRRGRTLPVLAINGTAVECLVSMDKQEAKRRALALETVDAEALEQSGLPLTEMCVCLLLTEGQGDKLPSLFRAAFWINAPGLPSRLTTLRGENMSGGSITRNDAGEVVEHVLLPKAALKLLDAAEVIVILSLEAEESKDVEPEAPKAGDTKTGAVGQEQTAQGYSNVNSPNWSLEAQSSGSGRDAPPKKDSEEEQEDD
eukprot:Skav201230  [mRNA]  locus=scaffold651:811889:822729:- [translate_table: standard]